MWQNRIRRITAERRLEWRDRTARDAPHLSGKQRSFLPLTRGERETQIALGCTESSARLWSPRAVSHFHLPLLPFLFLVEFPGFPKPILFSHSTFLPCQREGWLYMVLPWKHLLDGDGWEKEVLGRLKSQSAEAPPGFFPHRDPRFLWIYLHSSELCVRTRECGTLQRWEKGQMLSLVISLPPPKSLSDFFHGILLPALSTPSPFLRHWCSVQPEQGSFLVGCLGNMGCPERARATCRDFLGGSSAPSPVLGGIFWGGRINISYHSDCTGGLFLILSVHILHSWPQKQCSAPPSDSLSQGFLESTGLCFPQQALARALP